MCQYASSKPLETCWHIDRACHLYGEGKGSGEMLTQAWRFAILGKHAQAYTADPSPMPSEDKCVILLVFA